MRTAVTSTSVGAYESIKGDGTLTGQQRRIVDALSPGRDYSLQEVVLLTGIAINAVSGRCNELRALGLLELGDQRACTVSNRLINPVRLPAPVPAQGALFS